MAHALNEPANLLEALAAYARWQSARGRHAAAARAVATDWAHPHLHAELRDAIRMSSFEVVPAVQASDLLALVEVACAELTDAATTSNRS